MPRGQKVWTQERIDFLQEKYADRGAEWCWKRLRLDVPGLTIVAVRKAARTFGASRAVDEVHVQWTVSKDNAVRAAFASGKRGAPNALARTLGVSSGAVYLRGEQLGVRTRRSGHRMNEEQRAYIRAHAHHSAPRIVKAFKVKGWRVSEYTVRQILGQIAVSAKRRQDKRETMMIAEICDALGVTDTVVHRWIKLGWLPARQPSIGSNRGFLIRPVDLATLMYHHPDAINLRKVPDSVWLLDFVFHHAADIDRDTRTKDLRAFALSQANPTVDPHDLADRFGASPDHFQVLVNKGRARVARREAA